MICGTITTYMFFFTRQRRVYQLVLTNVTHPIGIHNPDLIGISLAQGLSFPLQNDMHKNLSIHGDKTW